MKRRWKRVSWDECPDCGCKARVLMDVAMAYNEVQEDDDSKCPECGLRGIVNCDDNEDGSVDPWVNWTDPEDA